MSIFSTLKWYDFIWIYITIIIFSCSFFHDCLFFIEWNISVSTEFCIWNFGINVYTIRQCSSSFFTFSFLWNFLLSAIFRTNHFRHSIRNCFSVKIEINKNGAHNFFLGRKEGWLFKNSALSNFRLLKPLETKCLVCCVHIFYRINGVKEAAVHDSISFVSSRKFTFSWFTLIRISINIYSLVKQNTGFPCKKNRRFGVTYWNDGPHALYVYGSSMVAQQKRHLATIIVQLCTCHITTNFHVLVFIAEHIFSLVSS